jgi:hypothetical protein
MTPSRLKVFFIDSKILKALECKTQDDLFSSLIQRSEPTLEELRIQKFALKTKALKMKLALLEV